MCKCLTMGYKTNLGQLIFSNEIKEVASEFLQKHKAIKDFLFMRSYSDGSRSAVGTNPEHVEKSIVFKKIKEDNSLILTEMDLPKLLFFQDIIDTCPSSAKYIYIEELNLLKSFNITQELIYNKYVSKDYIDTFSFYTHLPICKANIYFLNNLNEIEKFSTFFYAKAHSILKHALSRRIVSPKKSQKNYNERLNPLTKLSPQEIMVYQGIIEGLSSKEIGKHLNLSFRTVEHYTENVKNKFNALYKKDLMKSRQGYSAPRSGDF